MRRVFIGLACVVVLLVALPAAAQGPILLNPQAMVTFDSPDHAKAATYTIGWFTADPNVPASSETVAASEVTGSGPYAVTFKTRPAFKRYTLKLKMTAKDCDPGMCDSPWSEVATWTTATGSGMDVGYTPANPRGFVLQK